MESLYTVFLKEFSSEWTRWFTSKVTQNRTIFIIGRYNRFKTTIIGGTNMGTKVYQYIDTLHYLGYCGYLTDSCGTLARVLSGL